MATAKICPHTVKAIENSLKELKFQFQKDQDYIEGLSKDISNAMSGNERPIPEWDMEELKKYGFNDQYSLNLFFIGIKETYIKGPLQKGLFPSFIRFVIQNFDVYRDVMSFCKNFTEAHQRKLFSLLHLCKESLSKDLFVKKPFDDNRETILSLIHPSIKEEYENVESKKDEESKKSETATKFDEIYKNSKIVNYIDDTLNSDNIKIPENHTLKVWHNQLLEFFDIQSSESEGRDWTKGIVKTKNREDQNGVIRTILNKMKNEEDYEKFLNIYRPNKWNGGSKEAFPLLSQPFCDDNRAEYLYKNLNKFFKVEDPKKLKKYLNLIDYNLIGQTPFNLNTEAIHYKDFIYDKVSKSSILEATIRFASENFDVVGVLSSSSKVMDIIKKYYPNYKDVDYNILFYDNEKGDSILNTEGWNDDTLSTAPLAQWYERDGDLGILKEKRFFSLSKIPFHIDNDGIFKALKFINNSTNQRLLAGKGGYLSYYDGLFGKRFIDLHNIKSTDFAPIWELTNTQSYYMNLERKKEYCRNNGLDPYGFNHILDENKKIELDYEIDKKNRNFLHISKAKENGYGGLKYTILRELMLMLSPYSGEDFYKKVKELVNNVNKRKCSIENFLEEVYKRGIYNISKMKVFKENLSNESKDKLVSDLEEYLNQEIKYKDTEIDVDSVDYKDNLEKMFGLNPYYVNLEILYDEFIEEIDSELSDLIKNEYSDFGNIEIEKIEVPETIELKDEEREASFKEMNKSLFKKKDTNQ